MQLDIINPPNNKFNITFYANQIRDEIMEPLFVIIMIVLFFLLMAFIFSTALLTPLIGKKNFLFVIGLGFVVGLIGELFS
ncbi:hypothetical protein GCM10025860_18860 [Methanobacterium ferruginis]|nr:hypothetical protein GCM10025860_18860 [Methanobacterium ferruginis]